MHAAAEGRLLADWFLLVCDTCNLLVHLVEGDWHRRTGSMVAGRAVASWLMAAVDLLDGDAAGSRSAGRVLLGSSPTTRSCAEP